MNRLPQVLGSKVLHETKWVSLKELRYKDLKDIERSYITVERTTRRADLDVDAVIVLPLLKNTTETQAVLIRQFRPPLDNWTIELPAGLIDPEETIESTVAREIKEETGYIVSNIISIGPTIANDQGLTNGNCRFVVAEVEKDSNGMAQQQLEDTEMIEVLHVPMSKLLVTLHTREKDHGDSIDARLYSFALGQQLRDWFTKRFSTALTNHTHCTMSPEELTFTLVLLSLYVVPATFLVVRRLIKDPKGCLSRYFILHLLCLLVSYVIVYEIYLVIAESHLPPFDPYEILGVREYSTKKTIRKAYRALSKQFHPDKQRHDPLAASKFAMIAKAYEALTDPVGIKNYKKFGHPDGATYHLVDFKAVSGETGLTIIALVYGSMALVGVGIAMLSGDKYKPEMHMENIDRMMSNWHDKMSAFEILLRCVREVKQPLAEKASGDCCGGGGSLYEIESEVTAFLDLMESHQLISKLEHRDISRVEQDHIKRDLVALYYYLNERRARELELTVPCALHARMMDVVLRLPYLIEVFVEFSIKIAADKKSDATTIVTALRLLPALAQGSLITDAGAIAAQRQRLTTNGKVPAIKLSDLVLRVDDETSIYPKDWVTLHLKLTREYLSDAKAKAPLAGTLYDKKSKSFEYRKDHLWVIVQDGVTHHLMGAWKVDDTSGEVVDALGFWAPPIIGNRALMCAANAVLGDVDVEVRVLSTVYLGTEAQEVLKMKVVSPNSVIEEITDDE